jgi:hypothetical protein
MNKRNLIITALILVSIAQLYVPLKMILDREDVLKNGTEFRFRTEPVDPYDAFRGRYVWLNFATEPVKLDNDHQWEYGDLAYATLGSDEGGFAQFTELTRTKPDHPHYLKTEFLYKIDEDKGEILLPFDRFYMDEYLAPKAEMGIFESQVDTSSICYAIVYIKNGEAVLDNVYIDDVPIAEVAKKMVNEENQVD